jgi:hypothetical protein
MKIFYPPQLQLRTGCCTGCAAKEGSGTGEKPAREKEETLLISIDFDNVDISLLIKFISELQAKIFWLMKMSKGRSPSFHPQRYLLMRHTGSLNQCLRCMAFATVPSGASQR